MPDLIDKASPFSPGGLRVLREGSDVVLFAHGTMAMAAMQAAEVLAQSGIYARVVNVATMKPFNYAEAVKLCAGMRAVVTAEEHTYIGGLASAVALALRKSKVPMDYVAVNDCFGQSAQSAQELMQFYGLTWQTIVAKVQSLLQFGESDLYG